MRLLQYCRLAAYYLITAMQYAIILRALLSWIPQLYGSKLSQVLGSLTEPVVSPCRKLLRSMGFLRSLPLDFAPLLAYFLLMLVRSFLF